MLKDRKPLPSGRGAVTKVHIVTIGEYSDYRICAVFAEQDKHKADNYARMISTDHRPARVETFDLGAPVALVAPPYQHWCVEVDSEQVDCDDAGVVSGDERDCPELGSVAHWYNSTYLVHVIARDEAHALKIARDKVAEFKAREAGIA